MSRFWNGYQWRELADDRPREPELQPEPEPAPPAKESRLTRSMKPTRMEPNLERAFARHHVHEFVNDVCECGERES